MWMTLHLVVSAHGLDLTILSHISKWLQLLDILVCWQQFTTLHHQLHWHCLDVRIISTYINICSIKFFLKTNKCTLVLSSLLCRLYHCSLLSIIIHCMYLLRTSFHRSILHVQQLLSSNTLHSSILYSLNCEF